MTSNDAFIFFGGILLGASFMCFLVWAIAGAASKSKPGRPPDYPGKYPPPPPQSDDFGYDINKRRKPSKSVRPDPGTNSPI
jgi:hypothetical protein